MTTSTENYKQTLGRLRKQFVSSRFMRWWLGELSSMVPASLRPAGIDTESLTVVRLEQGGAFFRLFDKGNIQDAGSVQLQTLDPAMHRQAFLASLDKVRAGQRDVVLALPHSRILQKKLALPLATEENLRQVLEFQVEEYTPFSPDQVYFGYRVTGRDFERGQLAVDFVATPRGAVDQEVQTLNDWGTVVRAVVAEDMLSSGKLVNLLPADQTKAPSFLRHGINPWLAGLVVVLALTALALPVVIKREAVVQLMPWLEKGRTAAEATDALRRDLETKVDEHNYLLQKRQALPAVIVALEELTRILPDDTWVQQLDIKGKELQMQGETASSVRLIGLFEQSALFSDASFRSPLTKGQAAGTERYQLALQMRPVQASAAPAALPVTQPASGAVAINPPVAAPPAAPAVAVSASAATTPPASAAIPSAPASSPVGKSSAPAMAVGVKP